MPSRRERREKNKASVASKEQQQNYDEMEKKSSLIVCKNYAGWQSNDKVNQGSFIYFSLYLLTMSS